LSCVALFLAAEGEQPKPDEDRTHQVATSPKITALDTIYLRSGGHFRDVRVKRSNLRTVEFAFEPSGVSVVLPRKLVERIEFGESGEAEDGNAPLTFAGSPLSVGLMRKLTESLCSEPVRFEDEPLLSVLRELCRKAGTRLTVTPELREAEMAQRSWSLRLEEGRALLSVFREELRRDFPRIRVSFGFDEVRLSLKRNDNEGNEVAPSVAPEGGVEVGGEPPRGAAGNR
jgi:hypothetical protein